jgi:hypothetical protein
VRPRGAQAPGVASDRVHHRARRVPLFNYFLAPLRCRDLPHPGEVNLASKLMDTNWHRQTVRSFKLPPTVGKEGKAGAGLAQRVSPVAARDRN